MEKSTTLRLRAPRQNPATPSDQARAATLPRAVQPNLPRLNPISVTVKVLISEATLPAFQCAEGSAATYFKFTTVLDQIQQVTDPFVFVLLLNEHAPTVTLTLDYVEGQDLATLAERARLQLLETIDREANAVAGFLRSDLAGLLTLLLDAIDRFKRDLEQDSATVLGRYWQAGTEQLSQEAYFARFRTDYLGDASQPLTVLDTLNCGIQTLRQDGLVHPFLRPFGSFRRPDFRGDDHDTDRLLLCMGHPISHLANALLKLPAWVPHRPSLELQAQVGGLDELLAAHEARLQNHAQQLEEALFQERAARLIELTGDEHLRFSIEQGFRSRATYFRLLEKFLIERLREKVVRPLVAAGLLPSEDHIHIRLRPYHDGGELTGYDYEESRSPSLGALKLFAALKEFLRTDEVMHAFGVRNDLDPLAELCFRLASGSYYDDPDQELETEEAIVIADLFSAPLAPRADYLNLFIGKPSPAVGQTANQEGRP